MVYYIGNSPKRKDIETVKNYFFRAHKEWKSMGRPPLQSIKDFMLVYFPNNDYQYVYNVVSTAAIEMFGESDGKIAYRTHDWLGNGIWKFLDNIDDFVGLIQTEARQILGRTLTQSNDLDISKNLYPRFKEEIHTIETPIHYVKTDKIKELDKKYHPSKSNENGNDTNK